MWVRRDKRVVEYRMVSVRVNATSNNVRIHVNKAECLKHTKQFDFPPQLSLAPRIHHSVLCTSISLGCTGFRPESVQGIYHLCSMVSNKYHAVIMNATHNPRSL